MSTVTTRWFPDTCFGCIIDYTWDLNNPASGITFSNVISTCTQHSGITGSGLFGIIVDEDKRVNKTLQICINRQPALLSDSGVSGGNLASGVLYRFGWTHSPTAIGNPGRFLVVQFVSGNVAPTAVQNSQMQTAVNTTFSGSVSVGNVNVSGVFIMT